MPYTKAIPIRSWAVLELLLNYLQDQLHKNHVEYRIKKFRTRLPELTPKNFVARLKEAFTKLPKNPRGGRPVKVIAYFHVSRMPNYTWPKKKKEQSWEDLRWQEEEQEEYARLYGDMVAPDGLVMDCWHLNRLFGCGDTNQIVPNIVDLDRPRVRRRSDLNVITHARHVADAVTEILNAKRRENGRPLIQAMPERQRELAVKKHGSTLAQQLANSPEPVRLKNLQQAIENLGHTVSRLNVEGDTISVIFAKSVEEKKPLRRKKKSSKKKPLSGIDNTKEKRLPRISITNLLAEVYHLRKQQNRAPEAIPQIVPVRVPEKVLEIDQDFHDLRHEKIKSLIDTWHFEANAQKLSDTSQEFPGAPSRRR